MESRLCKAPFLVSQKNHLILKEALQSREVHKGRRGAQAKHSPMGRRDGLPPMKPMVIEQAAGGVARRRRFGVPGGVRSDPTRPGQGPYEQARLQLYEVYLISRLEALLRVSRSLIVDNTIPYKLSSTDLTHW